MPKKTAHTSYPAGRTITDVAVLEQPELAAMYWDRSPVVLVLDDGSRLYVSRDEEGNGPGALVLEHRDDLEVVTSGSAPGLVGAAIVGTSHRSVRGWSNRPLVLELSGRCYLVPQSDEEGNDAGTWFGTNSRGDFSLSARRT